MGGSGIAPLGTEWIGTTFWGAGLGAASHAGSIWAMGGNDYSKIWQGALIGGVMGFMASEQFGNWTGGKGFYSNDQVLKNFEAGKYDITGFDTWQDAALDHFGFEGKYDPTKTSKQFRADKGSYWGATKPSTGEVSYGKLAFESYDNLKGTYVKESYTLFNLKNDSYHHLPEELRGLGYDTYLEDAHGFVHFFRNQGLYRNHTMPLQGIELYQSGLRTFDVPYPTYPAKFQWIYKIPRLW